MFFDHHARESAGMRKRIAAGRGVRAIVDRVIGGFVVEPLFRNAVPIESSDALPANTESSRRTSTTYLRNRGAW